MIKAEAHSDDRACEVKFDATPWFEQATDQQILDLAACDWGGNYPADEVAECLAETNEDLAQMFKYVEIAHQIKDCGFECHVDRDEAMLWLDEHRPNIANQIDDLEND